MKKSKAELLEENLTNAFLDGDVLSDEETIKYYKDNLTEEEYTPNILGDLALAYYRLCDYDLAIKFGKQAVIEKCFGYEMVALCVAEAIAYQESIEEGIKYAKENCECAMLEYYKFLYEVFDKEDLYERELVENLGNSKNYSFDVNYEYGLFLEKKCEYSKALVYYKKAYEGGYHFAANTLIKYYYHGIGTNKDHNMVFKYALEKVSRSSFDCEFLANCYLLGVGTKIDCSKSYEYFMKLFEIYKEYEDSDERKKFANILYIMHQKNLIRLNEKDYHDILSICLTNIGFSSSSWKCPYLGKLSLE